MGLLPWSFGFLLVFSLLLWTQIKTVTETTILYQITRNSLEMAGEHVGITIEQHARPSKEHSSSHRSSSGESHGVRTSKLHLHGFFKGSGPLKDAQKKILFRLIEILYGNQPILLDGDNTGAVTALFEKVCKKGEELEAKIHLSKVEDLALISLRDDPMIPNLEHNAFYHMLRGGRGELLRGKRCKLEGLQYYVSLRSHDSKLMSLYLAPKNLLLALFGPEKEDVVTELMSYRQEVWKEFQKEKGKNRTALEKDFQQKFEGLLPNGITAQMIDFGISSSRPQDSPRILKRRH